MSHSRKYLFETQQIAGALDAYAIETMAAALAQITGRVYCIGIGGSLANAIHMAADLRKLCRIDAEAISNVAEITARANDDGIASIFSGRRYQSCDGLFVLSVGGGTKDVSAAIPNAIDSAKSSAAKVFGIVGPEGGYTAQKADYCIRVPAPKERVTPHTEAFQAVIWHLLVSHPILQKAATKW